MRFANLSISPDPPVLAKMASVVGTDGVSTVTITAAVDANKKPLAAGQLYAYLDGVLLFTSSPYPVCGNSVSARARARARCYAAPPQRRRRYTPPLRLPFQSIELPLGFGSITVIGFTCPLAAGTPATLDMGVLLPPALKALIPATFTTQFISHDQTNTPLYCINSTFAITG